MSNFNINSSNYLYNLRKQMHYELDLPDPQEILNKQNELEEKEQWIKLKLEEINKKEKRLQLKELNINNLSKQVDKQTNINNQKQNELKLLESELFKFNNLIKKNNLLPIVAKKKDLINFMNKVIDSYPNKKDELDKMMLDDDEYIVYNDTGRYGGSNKLIITNCGKMFYILYFSSRVPNGSPIEYKYYVNFNVNVMNKKILDALIVLFLLI